MLIRADLARYAHDQARQNSARRPRTGTQWSALQARSAIERQASRVRDELPTGRDARRGHRPVA